MLLFRFYDLCLICNVFVLSCTFVTFINLLCSFIGFLAYGFCQLEGQEEYHADYYCRSSYVARNRRLRCNVNYNTSVVIEYRDDFIT